VIAPDRVITHRIDEGDTGWLVVDVPLVEEPTWATAYGRAAEWVIVLFALVAIGWSLAARLARDRGRVDSPATSTSA
jgi:apolipoprotein N-acyltransferase